MGSWYSFLLDFWIDSQSDQYVRCVAIQFVIMQSNFYSRNSVYLAWDLPNRIFEMTWVIYERKYLKEEIEEDIRVAPWSEWGRGQNHLTFSLNAACEPRKCPTTPFGLFIHCIQKEAIFFVLKKNGICECPSLPFSHVLDGTIHGMAACLYVWMKILNFRWELTFD